MTKCFALMLNVFFWNHYVPWCTHVRKPPLNHFYPTFTTQLFKLNLLFHLWSIFFWTTKTYGRDRKPSHYFGVHDKGHTHLPFNYVGLFFSIILKSSTLTIFSGCQNILVCFLIVLKSCRNNVGQNNNLYDNSSHGE